MSISFHKRSTWNCKVHLCWLTQLLSLLQTLTNSLIQPSPMVQDSALLWTIVQKSKQESMSDSIWSLIQQSAIGPRWKSCYLSSWRTSHWVTVQNMIHFLVLDRTWLRKPYYMDGVKKLKLHKQNGLDTKKKQEVRKCSCEIYDFMSTSIWYEVREKRKPLDRLLPNWPMAAKSIVFEDSRGSAKKKGFIGKSRQ